MGYQIKCDMCGGDEFRVKMLKYSKLYFLYCLKCPETVYLSGGSEVHSPTPDDKKFARKAILFRKFT